MDDFDPISLLESRDLRITRPRLRVAEMLFADGKQRHVTAEWVAERLLESGESVAPATVYNTLHSFVEAGLMRQISGVRPGSIIFDTNVEAHYHFYDEKTDALTDIPAGDLDLIDLPKAPDGKIVTGVDVIIRLG